MYMKVTVKSPSLQRAAGFHVILPFHDGYPDGKRPYPTLYCLPGCSDSAEEIVFTLPLRQMSALYGIAVVVPDGTDVFFAGHPERDISAEQYAGDELVRNSRHLFPCLSHAREDTFIGGISTGGYGAMLLGLKHHDTFSKAALFSPTAKPTPLLSNARQEGQSTAPDVPSDSLQEGTELSDNGTKLSPAGLPTAVKTAEGILPDFWMCCGKQDRLAGDDGSRFRKSLLCAGAKLVEEDGPGEHDMIYWDRHLESAFRFLAGCV